MKERMIHPRPNPIIAAMYTLRDLNVDVVVIHGPAGCGFMASRMLEEAGVRVVTSGLKDNDLIFGGEDPLIETLHMVKERFDPKSVAVIGTCASMIIGEDMGAAISKADIGCNVFSVDCHGCMTNNTNGAIITLEAARDADIISPEEAQRQISLMTAATALEKKVGMAAKTYLQPARGQTKYNVCKRMMDVLASGGKVAAVMIAKKELAYRFADLFVALDEARRKLGGTLFTVANLDKGLGLPRIRGYCDDILNELKDRGITPDAIVGGLDEYALVGERMRSVVDEQSPDLTVIIGICHAYPDISPNDILITDQPRQLANYLSQGFTAVGEISSHSMVMSARNIIHLETSDMLREMLEGMQ